MDNCWKDEIRVRLQKRDARQKDISSLVQNLYLNTSISLQSSPVFALLRGNAFSRGRLSRCRGDAVSLSRRASALEAGLCEREVELERLSVEHAALRLAHAELEAGLSRAKLENSRLLQQIVEEKRGEAERMNEQNEIQESSVLPPVCVKHRTLETDEPHCEQADQRVMT
ncbi:UNVERIFIED_CONTAM: hypothetical protein FKN15_012370 [Acipenser sinensis]